MSSTALYQITDEATDEVDFVAVRYGRGDEDRIWLSVVLPAVTRTRVVQSMIEATGQAKKEVEGEYFSVWYSAARTDSGVDRKITLHEILPASIGEMLGLLGRWVSDNTDSVGNLVFAPVDYTAQVNTLRDYTAGVLEHEDNGLCPDQINGPEARDPECQVCRALMALDMAEG